MRFAAATAFIALTVIAAGSVRAHGVDPTKLPVGDGKVTTTPLAGNVYSCSTRFRSGAGAHRLGDWFHGETWNPLEKPHVRGEVMWPEAEFSMAAGDDEVQVEGNGLPVDQPTGKFPIARSDPAYAYDRNPNGIEQQDLDFSIPAVPVRASSPGCLPMGMVGFTMTGVALYNALDAEGRDAAAHEVQDLCNGHPQQRGQYHYHSSSPCLPGHDANEVVGWALDGYPIMGMRGADGALLTNDDLDACHGRAEDVTVDGRPYDYAYRLTLEYPYIIGCYTGMVPWETRSAVMPSGPPQRGRGQDGRRPR